MSVIIREFYIREIYDSVDSLYLYQVALVLRVLILAHLVLSSQTKLSRDAADKLVSRVQRGGRHPRKAAHRSNKPCPESQHSVSRASESTQYGGGGGRGGEGEPRNRGPRYGRNNATTRAGAFNCFRSCPPSFSFLRSVLSKLSPPHSLASSSLGTGRRRRCRATSLLSPAVIRRVARAVASSVRNDLIYLFRRISRRSR